MEMTAVLLVGFVPVIALAVSLSQYQKLKWKFRELQSENRSLLRSLKNRHEKTDLLHSQIQELSRRLMYRDFDFDSLQSDYRELKQQLENPPSESVYLTQLQLKNQDLQSAYQSLLVESAQLRNQKHLLESQILQPQVELPQAQCHCSNQDLNRSDCC